MHWIKGGIEYIIITLSLTHTILPPPPLPSLCVEFVRTLVLMEATLTAENEVRTLWFRVPVWQWCGGVSCDVLSTCLVPSKHNKSIFKSNISYLPMSMNACCIEEVYFCTIGYTYNNVFV